MCLYLLQSFWVPNSNGEVTGHCSHVFPVGIHCYTRNSPSMGPHNSGVSTGRDVKNTKIALSEASDRSEKDINLQCIKLWCFTMFNIYTIKTNSLLMFLPGFSFHLRKSLLQLQAPRVLKIILGHKMFILVVSYKSNPNYIWWETMLTSFKIHMLKIQWPQSQIPIIWPHDTERLVHTHAVYCKSCAWYNKKKS